MFLDVSICILSVRVLKILYSCVCMKFGRVRWLLGVCMMSGWFWLMLVIGFFVK